MTENNSVPPVTDPGWYLAHELGTHLQVDCDDSAAHQAHADSLQIPKCLENRENQRDLRILAQEEAVPDVSAFLCVSAYCGRCQEMRQYYGLPVIDPNAWLLEADEDARLHERVSAEFARNNALMLTCKLWQGRFAPTRPAADAEDRIEQQAAYDADVKLLLELTESIRIRIETVVSENPDNETPVIEGFERAAELLYGSLSHVKRTFPALAETFAAYIAGDIDFTVPEDEGKF